MDRVDLFAAHALGGYVGNPSFSDKDYRLVAKMAFDSAVELDRLFEEKESNDRIRASAAEEKAREPYLQGQKPVKGTILSNSSKYYLKAADKDLDVVPAMRWINAFEAERWAKAQGMILTAQMKTLPQK